MIVIASSLCTATLLYLPCPPSLPSLPTLPPAIVITSSFYVAALLCLPPSLLPCILFLLPLCLSSLLELCLLPTTTPPSPKSPTTTLSSSFLLFFTISHQFHLLRLNGSNPISHFQEFMKRSCLLGSNQLILVRSMEGGYGDSWRSSSKSYRVMRVIGEEIGRGGMRRMGQKGKGIRRHGLCPTIGVLGKKEREKEARDLGIVAGSCLPVWVVVEYRSIWVVVAIRRRH